MDPQIAVKTLIEDSQALVKTIIPSAKWSMLFLPLNLSVIFFFGRVADLKLFISDPDPTCRVISDPDTLPLGLFRSESEKIRGQDPDLDPK